MALKVSVIKAENLKNVEASGMFGKAGASDPYAVITFEGEKKKTKVIDDNLNPEWNETFEFPLKEHLKSTQNINVQVFDHEKVGSDRLLGSTSISGSNIIKKVKIDAAFDLRTEEGGNQGKITLRVEYIGAPQQEKKEGGAEGTAETTAGGEAEGDGGGGGSSGGRRTGNAGRKRNSNLSTLVQDYHIRVNVIEGRALQGSNLDPAVRVQIGKQMFTTRPKRGTTRPYWNELLFFNFHEAPSTLFWEMVDISCTNTGLFKKDSLIGSFQFDVGSVYEEDGHSFMHKWVMLTDPVNRSKGVQGYIKISISVLGPGDEAPLPKPLDESEDIENNLLKPAGVDLDPIDLTCKIFMAEDLPQMDVSLETGLKALDKLTGQEGKSFCDPYVKVSFAGKDAKTEVIQNTYVPHWFEELHLEMQVPSMCDRLTVQLYDQDMLSDDVIATHFFSLGDISSTDTEKGFLPIFGPSWVNFYGAPREHSMFEGDHAEKMNEGLGEGCAYRGRVLLELSAGPAPDPLSPDYEEPEHKLDENQQKRVEMFQSQVEFYARAILYESDMMDADELSKDSIQYEASMGNRGNKFFDESSTSVSAPVKPQFDGTKFYFLPWGNKKPVLEVFSEWEDICYRLWSLNRMRSMSHRLHDSLKEARAFLHQKPKNVESATASILSAINTLIRDCRRALPEFPEIHTRLDEYIRDLREGAKENIASDADKLREALTNNTRTIEEALEELDNFYFVLKNVGPEPQLSIPDLIFWILADNKRKAYYRMSPADLIWSDIVDERGPLFNQVQNIYFKWPKASKKPAESKVPSHLRCRVFFGKVESKSEWPALEADYVVLAEAYENNRFYPLKGWTDTLLPTDPKKWTDREGDEERSKDQCELPDGWMWKTDWYIDPELTELDEDAGLNMVVEETYENQRYFPIKGWSKVMPGDRPGWSDINGHEERLLQKITISKGWLWDGEWQIDKNRAVDSEGWEYAFEFSGEYHASKKKTDLVRRRRWARTRNRNPDYQPDPEEEAKKRTASDEGWEYSLDFHGGHSWHARNKTSDCVRRRRWRRERVPNPGAPALGQPTAKSYTAGSYLVFREPQVYQLRCHLYQARSLIGEDKSGLSDPYVILTYGSASGTSLMQEQTICPLWDQTIVIDSVKLYGTDPKNPDTIPPVLMEIYDHDTLDEDDLLGRLSGTPVVRSFGNSDPAILKWHEIIRGHEHAGEALFAFELIPSDDRADFPLPDKVEVIEDITKKQKYIQRLPHDIRPEMERCKIEIMCWGLRDIAKYMFMSVDKPHIEFECGGKSVVTPVLKTFEDNPNFPDNRLLLELDLPKKIEYLPPLNIRVFDNRVFGRRPLVGAFTIESLIDYRVKTAQELEDEQEDDHGLAQVATNEDDQPLEHDDLSLGHEGELEDPTDVKIENDDSKPLIGSLSTMASTFKNQVSKVKNMLSDDDGEELQDDEIDWWSKFYKSLGQTLMCQKYDGDTLDIYDTVLENKFKLDDALKKFTLFRGKQSAGDYRATGIFKGNLRVFPVTQEAPPPSPWEGLPDNTPVELVVRVYVVRGIELQAQDSNGKSDPYVTIVCGDKKLKDRDNYIPANLNPVFGRAFELTVTLPKDNTMTISVFDYDLIGGDDLIGETKIDLEDRLLSRYRATCGLPQSYLTDGINKWRDALTPKEILEQYCESLGYAQPQYSPVEPFSVIVPQLNDGKPIVVKAKEFETQELSEQNAALRLLRSAGLVPEHIETRRLTTPTQPDIEQGKLQMWVDIFPRTIGDPGEVVNIAPRKPKKLELRFIVWNVVEVPLTEENFAGERMTDIYLKTHIAGLEDEGQQTDVHYRSLNGEGNFNWRKVFPFDYLIAEDKVVVQKKAHFFSLDKEEEKLPPLLNISIWDNDLILADTFISSIELDLTHFEMPAKTSQKVNTVAEPDKKYVNLFKKRRVNGWIPAWKSPNEMAGKIEIEIEILSKEEAEEKPAGKGQDDPNQHPTLSKPNRPATSFLWITSPWKSMKYIIWANYKWKILLVLGIILFVIWLALFIYYVPPAAVQKTVGL